MSGFDCDLLVIGMGPVGDTLAALGRLHGLSVIAIDRSPEPHPLPRAAIVDHEIMRIMQMIGVADRVSQGMRTPSNYQFLTAEREILLDFKIATRGPFGWAESYAFHQPSFEATIRKRMVEMGVDVRNGVAFTALEQSEDGVVVTVEQDSRVEKIRARYAVGCDGAGSPVRQALGIALTDFDFDEPWLVLDVLLDDEHALPVVAQQICDPKRPTTHLAMNDGRYRWEFMIKPGEDTAAVLEDAFIYDLLAPWGCADHIRVERKAVYHFHGLIAQEWRRGRVLIAGDAAHQMPPFAGQGMCSGIRDAVNLAWKIAAVVRGAPDAILDSYQEERAPHAQAILETAIAMGRVVCLLDEEQAAGRNAGMLARKAAGEQDVSIAYPDLHGGLFTKTPGAGGLLPQPIIDEQWLDTLLGHDGALIGRYLPRHHGSIRLLDVDGPELAPFAGDVGAWLEQWNCDAVLVRPDRHIFGTGDAAELLDRWDELLGAKVAA
ncbi:bifunctional 3-(3-hydroxy-phenyl)propionate/3-hydroxycinnamic acid hydroxylase [Sphingomonas sp. RB3P16]|uniref:bifunctional 3-(3-hydroxy-phenyl)propionate/3-hydroxycinnamic acid hydroxylase n=1 Tax=Parasphingomonas frigoris TaxID=3096163 RepID=UPI002FCAF358